MLSNPAKVMADKTWVELGRVMGKAFVFKMNGTDFVLWNLYQNCEVRVPGFTGVAEYSMRGRMARIKVIEEQIEAAEDAAKPADC